jgi:putative ABC transport system permease protein
VFINEAQLRQMVNRSTYDANEIVIINKPGYTQEQVRDALKAQGLGDYATIQTQKESIPQFLDQIKDTFGLLGNVIGAIGLVVASITIFIIIFVNIVTRRKYIGILKGIGVSGKAIEISYMAQSAFYAIMGAGLGSILVFFVLVPLFYAYPINFPFSDGILAVTYSGVFTRAIVLMVCTIIAGYIPARMIVRKNTLDSILGR